MANRYTNIRANDYNPMTLQEMMLVPQYKRNQHDALLEAGATMDTNLLQVDPLDLHLDVTRKEQERLSNAISSQVDALNKEGFSQRAKSNFVKLNKDFQSSIAPTGMLGKVAAARQTYAQNQQNYMQNAIKQGYSPEQAQRNWMMHHASYAKQFEQTGAVEGIGSLMAPKYVDHIKEAKEVFKAAGISSTDIGRGENSKIRYNPVTNRFEINKIDTRQGASSNVKQLTEAVDYFNNQLNNQNSDMYKSIVHQGKTPQEAASDILNLAQVYETTKVTDHRSDVLSQTFAGPTGNGTDSDTPMIKDMILGTGATKRNPNSPLLQVNKFKNARFDEQGNIVTPGSEFKTYKEKVDAARKDPNVSSVRFNNKTGLYEEIARARNNAGVGSYNTWVPIPKDEQHMKSDLDKVRTANPDLRGLSDRDLINRLADYSKAMESNYVEGLAFVGADNEWLNDRMFGNLSGSGEKNTSGTSIYRTVTMDGSEITLDQVAKKLGYGGKDKTKKFREEGQPKIQYYSPALGKYVATARDSKGREASFYIDADDGLKATTRFTQFAHQAAMDGSAFKEMRISQDQSVYFVNDFTVGADGSPGGKFIFGKPGASSAAKIELAPGAEPVSIQEAQMKEKANLRKSPLFKALSGIE